MAQQNNKLGLILAIELDAREQAKLLQNSIERVLNNAIEVGSWAQDNGPSHISEQGSTLWQDCEELKQLVVQLWGQAQEELRKELILIKRNGLA